jgi:hypothetical protein
VPARGRMPGAGTLPIMSRELMSPPMPMDSVETWLRSWGAPRDGVRLGAVDLGGEIASSSGSVRDMSTGMKEVSASALYEYVEKSRWLHEARWGRAPYGRLLWLRLAALGARLRRAGDAVPAGPLPINGADDSVLSLMLATDCAGSRF